MNTAGPDLLTEAVDDLDTREITLMDRAIKCLTGKCLLVNRAIGIAIKKTSQLVFKLMNALNRLRNQSPCQVLIGKPFAAFDGVHKVPLDRVALGNCNVVSTLNHACAAAFTQKPLYCNRDRCIGRMLMGMQGCKKPRTS